MKSETLLVLVAVGAVGFFLVKQSKDAAQEAKDARAAAVAATQAAATQPAAGGGGGNGGIGQSGDFINGLVSLFGSGKSAFSSLFG